MKTESEQIAEILQTGNIACLTGAGISTAAGIPDFRGHNGLYTTRKYNPDTVFDIDYFTREPKPFFDFSRDLLSIITELKPTFTHYFLAELEKQGLLNTIITQNIDPLHQQAGTKNIICLHGNYASSTCCNCKQHYNLTETIAMIQQTAIPQCKNCNGIVKPDIVFFGENVHGISEAAEAVTNADTLLILGSSLVVYPAASLPELAKRVIVVNKGEVRRIFAEEEYYIDIDLDLFFKDIAKIMNITL